MGRSEHGTRYSVQVHGALEGGLGTVNNSPGDIWSYIQLLTLERLSLIEAVRIQMERSLWQSTELGSPAVRVGL